MTDRASVKIVFTGWSRYVQDVIWNENSRRAAERLGFTVEILSPRESMPEQAEWRRFLKDAEAIITAWGFEFYSDLSGKTKVGLEGAKCQQKSQGECNAYI